MHKDNCKSVDLDTQCIKIIFDINKIKGEEWSYIREFLYAVEVKLVLIQLRFIFQNAICNPHINHKENIHTKENEKEIKTCHYKTQLNRKEGRNGGNDE